MIDIERNSCCADCWCRYCVNNIECDMEGEDFFCDGCSACNGWNIVKDPEDCPHKAYKGESDVEKELEEQETPVTVSQVLLGIKHILQDEYWKINDTKLTKDCDKSCKDIMTGRCIGLSKAIKVIKEYELADIRTVSDLNHMKTL